MMNLLRTIVSALLISYSILSFSATDLLSTKSQPLNTTPVVVKWNIPVGQSVGYKLKTFPLTQNQTNSFTLNFKGIFNTKKINKLDKLSIKMPSKSSIVTVLQGLPNKNISVKMIPSDINIPSNEDKSKIQATLNELLTQFKNTVQLRAEINTKGEVTSFWLARRQKNVVEHYFQLPDKAVKIGDSWPLAINLVTMDGDYISEKSSNINKAVLTSIRKEKNGDLIAVINYQIAQSVSGKFNIPNLETKKIVKKPANMSMSYIGQAEFIVNKGLLKSNHGVVKLKASGITTADSTEYFKMDLMNKIPNRYLKIQ